ncbi:hypothetical protein FRC14_007968 [Serendipita sp. 396]|nr:hypothetical protein FRC14_007968 [Serendipita sp. 396]KAG8786027.1 hypothetical protein FRC15_000237 [Serendipita sp. 397]KAG8801487.1 hypothetical protein FRC16_000368 [Serendipita sp. 398]KAG8873224.1 hypothetical protein FRC20_008405 [Serendipita sp. 405]
MATEDLSSMFAGMKKKAKKPKVAFASEPAAPADADPTYQPREPIDDPSLGPSTVHEQIAKSSSGDAAPPTEDTGDGDDAKNMFADMKKKKKAKVVTIDEGEEAIPVAEAADSLDFGEMKKKKKKKEIPLDLEAVPAPAEDGAPIDDFSDLKKKKKKKEIPLDLEEETAEPTDDFSELKKKKKKKTLAMEEFEKEVGDEPAPVPVSKPKKPKKVVEESDGEEGEDDGNDEGDIDYGEVDEEELGENPFAAGAGGMDPESEAWLGSDRDYTYEELLSRFFRLLHAANPSLASSSSKRYTLAPPSIHREGNKKSVFANIGDICRRMHREPAHVIAFLYAELGTTGSIDGSGRLIIKGKFQQKQIENILRRYIMEYVTCRTCKSPNTLLTKETRISFITCETCGSRQSVSAIKTGFQAQVGKRKKQQV